ncbi:MAG TPA: PQQ-binding-like beta-propeller repeat protein [Thermoanaerobaculia bacterium]|nr:PQQ-binding-like beta-propeller repeat protein [Thermoanaerobaculia bacterium]
MSLLFLRRVLILPAVVIVLCGFSSADWPMFRHDALRTASQLKKSPLSDPKLKKLEIGWRFPKRGDPNLENGFRASPVVYKGRVFIGNGNGFFYALCAKTGKKLWQYPPEGSQALQSKFHCDNPSSFGIASSATIAKIYGRDAVIFAAPDPRVGTCLGEGRLFALDTRTGREIWASPVIARLNGCTKLCPCEFHENLGYSSPLVLGDKVYVGVADHCDNPVQQGRVAAVRLADGQIVGKNDFEYCSTGTCGDGTRGGGVGSSPAGWKDSIFITTGNTRSGHKDKPSPNHGLSLLRLAVAGGTIDWEFQPVPWERDADPDWSATPTIMKTRCGRVIVSTQKDGWTHAVKAADGKRLWSFPPQTTLPFRCGDGTVHGDSKYMRSGAAWGDVYVTMNGGLDMRPNDFLGGYRRLHALNVCEPGEFNDHLRWLIDLKDYTSDDCADPHERCLGNPTITRGIVYIGTNTGHLLALGDPEVLSQHDGLRCENSDVVSGDCENAGYRLVPQPKILASIDLDGSMVYTEPALANGKIYVSTDESNVSGGGFVYMLRPVRR